MPIEKVVVGKAPDASGRLVDKWEIRATGKEVNDLKPMLKETAWNSTNENQKAIAKAGWDYISDQHGKRTQVRADAVDSLKAQGWGQWCDRPTAIVDGFAPDNTGSKRAGRKRYRWNKDTREMEEICSDNAASKSTSQYSPALLVESSLEHSPPSGT